MPKKLRVHIKRFDKDLPLPAYHSKGAVCFDCCARASVTVAPQETALVPLNVAIQPPKDHFVLLVARSSFYKRGLITPNGLGIGDEDFSGDGDEYHFPVFNYTSTPVVIERGARIAQMLVMPYKRAHIREVKSMRRKTRGGFGTTGK
ncbi:MAG: dUTP diphosphatase [Candidatus Harrisonbacteria bacterium]|nr:dUTP diphosphatase [Candidatus Harrisonbacteria bacterium]MBI2406653.1 dUTP diphosphatase [Candidatus Harrisonbacteria bacterium]MBI2604194.1 dUTP diphosphatase [Candidatus Harrisonbacteria bacterium]